MLVLLVVALLGGVCGAVDLTVTDRATGSAVVNAVVDFITQSCVFDNDRLTLRRIAYAETRDGAAGFTFTRGGIWQVDEASFRSTQASLSAALKYNILDKFGVDWTQTQYEDLSKPLHSGIAAMLKIAKHYGSTDIPQSVASQARYWASSYTVNTWTDAIYVYTKASDAVANTCSSPKADVVFVVDSSASIKSYNFVKVKSFIAKVVDSFDISSKTVRVGLIQFSKYAAVQFDLRRYSNKQAVKTAVAAIPYLRSGTNSADGLNETTKMIKRQGRHDDGIPVVVIFLTDGISNNARKTVLAANNLHATLPQVTVFAVGVGLNIRKTELMAIASAPECTHVYYLANFNDITAFTNQIMNGACKAQAELEEGREVSGVVKKDQHYYFKIKVRKDKNGVRIQMVVKSGAVKAYYSWKVQNPNSALYDVVVDVVEGSEAVHIGWNEEAEKNADAVVVSDISNQTTMESPLYGAVVGVYDGSNEFTLSYTDSAGRDTGHILLLLAAFVVLISNYF